MFGNCLGLNSYNKCAIGAKSEYYHLRIIFLIFAILAVSCQHRGFSRFAHASPCITVLLRFALTSRVASGMITTCISLYTAYLFTQWQIGAVDKILTKKPLDLQQRLCMCERYRVSQYSCYFSIFANCQEPCPADALAQFFPKKYHNVTSRQTFITSISAKRGLTAQKPNRSDTYLPAKRSKRQNSLIMNAASKIKYSYHVTPVPCIAACSLQQNF